MKCVFCVVDMIRTDEPTREGDVYSDRFTCPKCGTWERANFRLGKEIQSSVKIVEDYLRKYPDAWDTLAKERSLECQRKECK